MPAIATEGTAIRARRRLAAARCTAPIVRRTRKISNGAWRGLGPSDEHALVGGEDGVGREQRVGRLAQPAAGQRPRAGLQILARDDHQIDVAIELQVLEPIVEDVHRRAEVVLGETARQVAIARREDRDARQLPRQHQRLVAGPIEIRADAVGVAHDDHTVFRSPPRVAATQDRRTLAHGQQLARQARHGRRLASRRRPRGCRR